ncbi:hypothetical protein M378DRAFT_158798 [Amanita muscaria Koide BX008]|uniref:Uncharacterized protein n=1 Tax=Amanita muscaria (strain Koide BX008) TaxID=946122 RepID=A0A0C2XH39_AMAMK|nr:hypothetical protein M378DRAFT_158798 [Amanita muscaria Koide BX008]
MGVVTIPVSGVLTCAHLDKMDDHDMQNEQRIVVEPNQRYLTTQIGLLVAIEKASNVPVMAGSESGDSKRGTSRICLCVSDMVCTVFYHVFHNLDVVGVC